MTSPARQELGSRTFFDRKFTAFLGHTPEDLPWDAFLESTPLGQFQQSSLWAEVKSGDGWDHFRVVIEEEGRPVAGFQVLHRRRGPFRSGFLNKGPVDVSGMPEVGRWVMDLIKETAQAEGLNFILAQAPDEGASAYDEMVRAGFLPNGLTGGVIDATLVTPLRPNGTDWTTRLRKTTQLHVRQAKRRGAVVRVGGPQDASCFFDLMEATCRRQKVRPNPATPRLLQVLIDVFHSRGLARLSFADCEGKPTAGVLCLRFGNRVTLWKKGWNEQHRDKHPNSLVCHESMVWAASAGAELYDFVGARRDTCTALLRGDNLLQSDHSSTDFFQLGFAAEPRLLPRCLIWFPRLHFRTAYRAAVPVMKKLGRIRE